MQEDVQRMYAFAGSPPKDRGYIPSLYIKSDFKFDPASQAIEEAMHAFKDTIQSEQLGQNPRFKPSRNLPFSKWKLINTLKKNDKYIIVDGDKNLGPCIIDCDYYTYRGCQEHLGNTRNYKELTKNQANDIQRGLQYKFRSWLGTYRPRTENEKPVEWTCISNGEETFLQ